jgi:predicted dehydrogenase
VKIGILGCGNISRQYATNARAFDTFEVVACADLDQRAAEALADIYAYEVLDVEELIAAPGVEVILNLTPPAAHVSVTEQALAAGKHVYSEKPLATTPAEAGALVAKAERLGLQLGCAPDTFLGSAYQAARELLDGGEIGEPLSVSAAMLMGGQATWHPNPDIFFADGAGPLLDMGPYYLSGIVALLGPVRRVAGFASTRVQQRAIAVGPRAGERFTARTPTHTVAAMELDGGVTATLTASFEAPGQYVTDFVVYGTEGALLLPDPNSFAGPLRIRRRDTDWTDVSYVTRGAHDVRGIGVHDFVEAVVEDRPPRVSGALAEHVVDVARSILAAAGSGTSVEIGTRVDRPASLPVGVPAESAESAAG